MKVKLSLDTAAGGLLTLLVLLTGLVILIGVQAGVRVSVDLPKDQDISPLQTITLTFSEPVDFEMASSVIALDPVLEGYLERVDERNIRFVPIQPFQPGVNYTLILNPDVLTADGNALKKGRTWQFRVREPLIAFLSPDATDSGIWSIDLNGNPPHRLTNDETQVISFDAAPNGNFIVFTVINEQGGVDLWQVSRGGNDESILLDCGTDRCTRTAISPNGRLIAYSREASGISPDLPFGSPRIWVLDLQTGQNNPLYEDQQILGYGPTWSPDSNKLASFDGLSDQIFIIDLKKNKQFIFPSNTGGPVAWSPDSNQMLYTTIEQTEDGLRTQVRLADLTLEESQTLIGAKDPQDYSYYSLAWSSAADRAILSFRAGEERPEQVFWLFDPSTLEGILIADQEGYTYNSPQWDPWGNGLVFQQFKLRGQFNPEISLWQPGFTEPLTLTKGLMPHWLP